MAQGIAFLRYAISREDLGWYKAVVVGGVYEFQDGNDAIDVTSPNTFIQPLRRCVEEHSHLSAVVKNPDTEKPFFESVSTVNLEDHVFIADKDDGSSSNGDDLSIIEKALPPILDRSWPASIPAWRIVVVPLRQQHHKRRCLIAFAFSHTIGDGMTGLIFHRTFLNACQQITTSSQETIVTIPSNRTIPPPFDTPERLPISWGFLLGPLIAAILPGFITRPLRLRAHANNAADAGTWTGGPVFFDPASFRSRVRVLEVDGATLVKALRTSREHGAKLTATVHQLVVRALSRVVSIPDVTNFVAETDINMRGAVGLPETEWGLFANGHYEKLPRVDAPTTSARLPDEAWKAAAAMTKNIAESAVKLQDTGIGLLRYAPSVRKWLLGHLSGRRNASYEVSNLLAFDGRERGKSQGQGHDVVTEQRVEVTRMVFAQSANVVNPPLSFNIISVKGGGLTCTVSWQEGALGVPVDEEYSLVDEICSSLRADFQVLGEEGL